MRIRGILVFAFLFSALIPSAFFGWWAYQDSVDREFSEVSDRHLVLAKNLGQALERYHVDLVAISESVTEAMIAWEDFPSIKQLLADLNIENILLVNSATGKIISKLEHTKSGLAFLPAAVLAKLKKIAVPEKTTFSQVMASSDGSNIMYAVKSHDRMMAVTRISTNYFVQLGKSISFGVKGHAAIVDNAGNVLAHPLPSWIKSRKNIKKVSAVKRMLNGETGIEQFYSPALKGDMIAGITAVKGPGWGVMIPQPVVELYDNAALANRSIYLAIAIGVLISFLLASIILKILSNPMNKLVDALHDNAENKRLSEIHLPSAILNIVELKEFQDSYNSMVKKISSAGEEMEILAYTDSVTKLPNRMRFQQITTKVIADSSSSGQIGGSLIFVDVDNFKVINDLFGHAAGDKLLRRFAGQLTTAATQCAKSMKLAQDGPNNFPPFVSRIGGDEFTILVPGLVDKDHITVFLDTLLDSIHIHDESSNITVDCSASIGCARYPVDASNLTDLMRFADIAMYHAKKSGKSCAKIYNPQEGVLTENEIRLEFSKAIKQDQLELEYQPKICSRRKEVYGVEALVRWDHPKFGRMFPDGWIPAISQSSLILDLGHWVIERAMRDMKEWREKGYDINVGVNISAEQLTDRNLVSVLRKNLRKYDINAANFEIEITEDTLFSKQNMAASVLTKIRKMGVTIAIDDFGKGYSNFARLAELPIDFLKLDRNVVAAGCTDPKVNIILDATVVMAKKLNVKIVAEGIETLEMAKYATDLGANILQGFYFSRSIPGDQLLNWLDGKGSEVIDTYKFESDKIAA